MTTTLLLANADDPKLRTIDGYRSHGGYSALPRALRMTQDDVLAELEKSNLRGRGGAGFSMGKKASFLPHGWTSTWSATPTSPSRARSRTAT